MGFLPQRLLFDENDTRSRRLGARRPGTTFPAGPMSGDLFYETDIKVLWVWDGAAWQNVSTGGGGYGSPGIELYNPSSTPYVDFHRAATPAGDSFADYNVRLINDVNGELRLFGNLRVRSADSSGEIYFGGWDNGGNYGAIASNARRATSGHYILLFNGTGDTNTYLSPGGSGGSIVLRAANNGADIASFAPTQINFQDGSGADKFRFWNDGEFWCNDIGLGFADNPNNSGIYFNGGNLNMNFSTIYFRGNNDANHRINYSTTGIDGLDISGFTGLRFLFANGGGTMTWDNSGQLFTNYGCGLEGNWALSSRYAGAATGGCLKSKENGNYIRFGWDGTFRDWVDVTNVKNFVIDHPTKKDSHLVHACIEGPEAAVFYRGRAALDNGWVEIKLPEYFEDLCAEEERSVQLTCIADDPQDEWCPVLHATYPKNGKFYVGLGSGVVVKDQKFWWEVTAVRKDVSPVVPEPLRSEVEVGGIGPYTFIKEK